ncbi:flagellin [Comamonas kerstersii]|uniref:flagellin N-terminal helical domain-containing protein n=1 Tax=Comamonas kerstersii TaxID=225992 RepID=UPI001B320DC4|nr:flagellin [Comamonas kerstersii]QTW18961.1 flagellin [Comamonas kerstersii]
MAATINTNIASINAQRNLALSGQSLNTTMQRLSSGLRVNSAKDDAAGLAIAERMNTQVKGLTVAARNANDGISLAQTAEGALGKVGDMLQRMRELAVQASNATNSEDDRKALQAEVKQLAQEIDRVAKQTNFNGQKILDGSFAGAVFQVGANSGDNVTLGTLTDTRTDKLSFISFSQTGAIAVDASDTNISEFNKSIPDATTLSSLQQNIEDAIAASTETDPETDTAVIAAREALANAMPSITIGTAPNAQTVSLGTIDPTTSGIARLGQVITAINDKSADTGVTAFLTKENNGSYTIKMMSSKLDDAGVPQAVNITGLTVANAGFDTPAFTAAGLDEQQGITNIDVTTQSSAWVALKKIDSAIDQINGARATLGAMQTRFENAVNNIDIQVENLSAARGRIVDADFAVETANLSRTQILQQAGTAMVAQANQIPQNVLQLLQG